MFYFAWRYFAVLHIRYYDFATKTALTTDQALLCYVLEAYTPSVETLEVRKLA